MSRSEERWLIILFLLPTTAFMVLLLWVPFLQGIWMSFHQWPFMGEPLAGARELHELHGADYFWTAIRATLIYSLSTLFQLILALAAALAKQKFVGWKPLARHHDHLLRHAAGRWSAPSGCSCSIPASA